MASRSLCSSSVVRGSIPGVGGRGISKALRVVNSCTVSTGFTAYDCIVVVYIILDTSLGVNMAGRVCFADDNVRNMSKVGLLL